MAEPIEGRSPRHPTFAALRATALAGVATCLAVGLLAQGACTSTAPSPFEPDPGGIFPGAGGTGGMGGAGPDVDPTLGGPCQEDAQCNDGIACTFDACDHDLGLCRFTPDAEPCQNDVYCDGAEICDPKLGCRSGEPVGCGDGTACTLDACDEATHSCTHVPRDVDRDGDPDAHCPGGGDCDDADATVSSLGPEICANGKDDDCDGSVDERACTTAQHDTCAEPLEITASGTYAMDTTGAAFHYATSCGLPDVVMVHDVVAAVTIPGGPPIDVEVTARAASGEIAVAMAGQCGDAATEIACGGPFPAPSGGVLAKLRGRALGDPEGATTFPLYFSTAPTLPITVDVQFLAPAPVPTNETCGTAAQLTPGVPTLAYLLEAAKDLGTECASATGDLVYAFTLDTTANVDVYAASLDGDGLPSISLRGSGCALPEDEISCQSAKAPHVFWQSLPAGTYYVAVSASAPTEVSLTLEVSLATAPKPDETCAGAPTLAPNTSQLVDLARHQDDLSLGCLVGAVDAALTLDLAVKSDVLLVQRIAAGDTGAISLAAPACAAPSDQIACGSGATSPVRARAHNVPAGEYRAIVESIAGGAAEVTAFVRPASAPVLVPFADGCADVIDIPPGGGRLQGNTANASADFNAGCDQGGVPEGGAPDQLLRLVLAEDKRVILDMTGSAYSTLLDVRRGPACPGQEVPLGCTIGYAPATSFLDMNLTAGTYFVQIDGYALQKGPWYLDVFVVDP